MNNKGIHKTSQNVGLGRSGQSAFTGFDRLCNQYYSAQAMMPSRDERQQLREFILRIAAVMLARENPQDAASQLVEMTKSINGCASLSGLREAARDMVEWSRHLDSEALAAVDATLSAAGVPTLTQMRDKRYRAFAKILSRGRIGSDDDYRMVEAFLAETTLSDADVDEATRLQHEYRKAGEGAA